MNDNETVEQAYEDIRKKIKQYKTDSAYEHIACMYTVFAVEDMIDRIEAAHQREVAELRNGISELLDALQKIYDEECTSYGTGEVYDKWRKALREKGGAN